MTTAENYLQASLEHIAAASDLHEKNEDGRGHYVLSHYVAGLAVECMLRAYRLRIDPAFDSRHDLNELFRLSGFANIIPIDREDYYSEKLSDVTDRWSNTYRYYSEKGLRSLLRKLKKHQKLRGDFLKESSRRITMAARELVQSGADKWTS